MKSATKEPNPATGAAESGTNRSPGRAPGSTYWLIARNRNCRIEVLTIDREGEETLPVFSHKEEAETFLRLGEAGGGWRARESWPGELVSVLYGPCARVSSAALDPLPDMLEEKTVGLASLGRERLLDLVLGRGRSRGRTGRVRHRNATRMPGKTKKTGLEAHMSKAEREKRGGRPRPVDARDTDARPRNWLVAVTLLVLREQDSYGYELMERIAAFGFEAINPGNLYRTLRQMEKEDLCESGWETSEGGPARRVYSIIDAGASYLDSWAEPLR